MPSIPIFLRASVVLATAAALALGIAGCAAPGPGATTASPTDAAPDGTSSPGVHNNDPELGDSSYFIVGKYAIDGDNLVGDVPEATQKVWARFAQLFPTDVRPELTLFVAVDGTKSDGVFAGVGANKLHKGEFYLAVDVSGADQAVLDNGEIHEFAHLLTLRDSQVSRDPGDIESCALYATVGCPLDGSYLQAWDSKFYAGVTPDSLAEVTPADRYNADDFVSEYAATNPEEDIAESFTQWVLELQSFDGDSIRAQKLNFFNDYPELQVIKDQIRSVLNG